MHIIPIGIQCSNKGFKNSIQQSPTLPFDWMFSTPKFVLEILTLLLEKNMDTEEIVRCHFFYCDKTANMIAHENYFEVENGNILYNSKYNVIFPHDVNDEATVIKYIRRMERLKDLILNSPEELYFVYSSQSSLGPGNFTINGNKILTNVYSDISKIYKLISNYRTNYKVTIFDTIQEEDPTELVPNIVLYKLSSCNSWFEVVQQMMQHRDFFV